MDTSGNVPAVDAAGLAASHEIRIYTIALDPDDLETRPASGDAVDVATLRAIADAAEGRMFRVRSTADLIALAEALDRLEPSPSGRPPLHNWQQLWFWPAAGAALLLATATLQGPQMAGLILLRPWWLGWTEVDDLAERLGARAERQRVAELHALGFRDLGPLPAAFAVLPLLAMLRRWS